MSDFQKNDLKKGLAEYLPVRSILILLLLVMIGGMILGSAISWLILYLDGITLEEILKKEPSELTFHHRNLMRWVTLFNHGFTFLIPSLVLVYLLEKRNWKNYLNLNKIPKRNNLFLGTLLIFASFPLVQFTFWLNKKVALPSILAEWEATSENAILGLIRMDNPLELIFSLIVMAVLPALGEEFVFRGILQKNLERLFKNGHIAVWTAAFLFSAFHFQFMGFLPRFFLGVLLGYLFFWTRNLWIPIATHFIYNGFQVIGAYLFADELQNLNGKPPETIPIGITIFSFIFVAFIAHSIYKFNQKEISEL